MLQLGNNLPSLCRERVGKKKGSKSPALHGLKKDYETPKNALRQSNCSLRSLRLTCPAISAKHIGAKALQLRAIALL